MGKDKRQEGSAEVICNIADVYCIIDYYCINFFLIL